jgi:truncated hemoglobin YjbI
MTPEISGVFFCFIYLYIKMKVSKEDTKINPIVTEHWKFKFEKAISILLKSGHHPDELIQQIRMYAEKLQNEKNN